MKRSLTLALALALSIPAVLTLPVTPVDARRGDVWRQFYLDSGGSVTVLEGGLRPGAMVLEAPGQPGSIQRATVSPEPDGSVRQRGEPTADGGTVSTPG